MTPAHSKNPKAIDADADREYLKSLTLLYVEDDEDTREQMSVLLKRRVRHLVLATDGMEGLAAFRHQTPDLVLTDIRMPVMEGLSMAQRIRLLDSAVPIIVTTAFEQSDYFMRSIDVGVDRYIVKPVDFDRLERALLECAHRLRLEEQMARRGHLEDEIRRHRAVATLAAGVAHDYNNLLQSVLGNVGLALALLPADSEAAELLTAAQQSGDQAKLLSDTLRLLADGGLNALRRVPLQPLLTTTLAQAIGNAAITRQDSFDSDSVVMGDPRQLTALFEQLVTNAVEAMPTGGTLETTVTVLSSPISDAPTLATGRYVQVTLRDSGPGMSRETRDHAFDAYYTTKARGAGRGTGLGLTLAHSIVQRHGGAISLSSSPQQSTSIRVYLPLAADN